MYSMSLGTNRYVMRVEGGGSIIPHALFQRVSYLLLNPTLQNFRLTAMESTLHHEAAQTSRRSFMMKRALHRRFAHLTQKMYGNQLAIHIVLFLHGSARGGDFLKLPPIHLPNKIHTLCDFCIEGGTLVTLVS